MGIMIQTGTNSDEMKFTSSYIFILGRGTIMWRSSNKMIISKSTMESESINPKLIGFKVELLRNFLANIPLIKDELPIVSIIVIVKAISIENIL